MGLSDDDIKTLELILLSNTEQGDKIPGMGGARKLRIQLEGRGKRGGARVIYIDILTKERLYLLFAYPKNGLTYLWKKLKITSKMSTFLKA